MEEALKPVSSEMRVAHLNLIANGKEVLAEKKAQYLPWTVGGIAVLVLGCVIMLYEEKIKRERLKHITIINQQFKEIAALKANATDDKRTEFP